MIDSSRKILDTDFGGCWLQKSGRIASFYEMKQLVASILIRIGNDISIDISTFEKNSGCHWNHIICSQRIG
jgi:hypothetical protein